MVRDFWQWWGCQSILNLWVAGSLKKLFRFTDTLLIQFEESETQTVTVTATGFGSTIVTEPRLEPVFDFGPHFSQHDTLQDVVVFNKGRRLQRVHFKLENFLDTSCSTRKSRKVETFLVKVNDNVLLKMHNCWGFTGELWYCLFFLNTWLWSEISDKFVLWILIFERKRSLCSKTLAIHNFETLM